LFLFWTDPPPAAGLPEPLIAAPGPHYEPTSETTVLVGFADVIPVPLLQKVVSVGDLLMFIGLAALLVVLARHGGAPAAPRPMPRPAIQRPHARTGRPDLHPPSDEGGGVACAGDPPRGPGCLSPS
jgi:hypothetical protein